MRRRVWISLVGYSQTGARYRVETEDGTVLVERSRSPEFDACRVLAAQGLTGDVELWRRDGAGPAMVLDIEKAAKLTVSEGDFGLRVVEWAPMPVGQGDDDLPKAPGVAIAAAASGQGRRSDPRTGAKMGQSKRPLTGNPVPEIVATSTRRIEGPSWR